MIMTAVFLIICIAGAIGLTAAYLSSRESYQDERPEDDVPHQVQKDDSMSCRSGISMQNMSGGMVTKQDLRELESRILGRIAIMLIAGIGLLAVLIVLMRITLAAPAFGHSHALPRAKSSVASFPIPACLHPPPSLHRWLAWASLLSRLSS